MCRFVVHTLVAVVIWALAAAPSARATMLVQLPLERVTRNAAHIVHGTVAEVRWGRDASGLPATWVTLDVARTIKGRAERRIVIKQYGTPGSLDDGTVTRVAGLPDYAAGEEVVLFLRRESSMGFTSPVGFGQGKYVVRRREGRALARRAAEAGKSRDLDEFLAHVRRLATATR
jgi:hypothetical protein